MTREEEREERAPVHPPGDGVKAAVATDVTRAQPSRQGLPHSRAREAPAAEDEEYKDEDDEDDGRIRTDGPTLDLSYRAELPKNLAQHVMRHVTPLITLIFDGAYLGDGGAEAVAAALEEKHTTLRTLRCFYCGIGPRGAQAIAHALPTTRLARLDLTHNDVGTDGISALAEVRRATRCCVISYARSDTDIRCVMLLRRRLTHRRRIAVGASSS